MKRLTLRTVLTATPLLSLLAGCGANVESSVDDSASALTMTAVYDAETQLSHTSGGLDWRSSGGWDLFSNGYLSTANASPGNPKFVAGPASITVRAFADVAGGAGAHLVVSVGGQNVGSTYVTSRRWRDFTFNFNATAGAKEVRVAFDNDYYAGSGQDRNLIVQGLGVSVSSGGGGGGGGGGGTPDAGTPTPPPTPPTPPAPPAPPAPPPAPPADPSNLAKMADFWDSTWLSWNDGYDSFPVTWQGYSNVLHVVPNPQFIQGQRASGWTGENEINGMLCNNGAATCARSARGTRVPVHPGSHVTYGAWVWVTPSTIGAGYGGGFQVFMDVYSNSGRIKELQGQNGGDGVGRLNVPFGSSAWTYVEMNFTIASSYKADGAIGGGEGSQVVPTGIIPILQLNNWDPSNGWNEKATAYVRDTVLHVQ